MYVAGCDVRWAAWIREITCSRGFQASGPKHAKLKLKLKEWVTPTRLGPLPRCI
jgi:hypothetical protein